MEYLKVWTSFRQVIAPLNDAEKGRLFDAMLMYAETGEEPSEFEGNERFLWQVAKQDIDRTAQKCEALRKNASAGGFQKAKNRLANDSKSLQTVADDSKQNQTEANPAHNIKKSNIKKNNNKEIETLFAAFWSAYPRKEGKQTALKAFTKINPDQELLQTMLAAIERQKQTAQWKENGGQFIPHPATWLNGRRWEDEVVNRSTVKPGSAQDYEQRDYSNAQAEAMARFVAMNGGAL